MKKIPLIVAVTVWSVWILGMLIIDGWNLFIDNWFMTVTMAAGSFIAGATSEGGGAVAFPVMTLIYDINPSVARDFSVMIQSVGMTAASITIIAMKIKTISFRALSVISIGGFVGVIVGIEFISPLMSPPVVKLFFTSLWLGFGIVLFWINRHKERHVTKEMVALGRGDYIRLFLVGIIGGSVTGITGSGVDIVTFSLLVLFYGMCESVATPSSVVLMAINSVFAFMWKGWVSSGMSPEAWNYWLVCIPIVVVGAPLGAWFIRTKSRHYVVNILYFSIIAQYTAAIIILPLSMRLIGFSLIIIGLALVGFWLAVHYGKQRSYEAVHSVRQS